jgi:hypothetical protein
MFLCGGGYGLPISFAGTVDLSDVNLVEYSLVLEEKGALVRFGDYEKYKEYRVVWMEQLLDVENGNLRQASLTALLVR